MSRCESHQFRKYKSSDSSFFCYTCRPSFHCEGSVVFSYQLGRSKMSLGPRDSLLVRPQWTINNMVMLPMVSIRGNNTVTLRGIVNIQIPVVIFLDTLFSDGSSKARSIEDDQFHIFKSVEGVLQSMGVDGKTCLLRTICELQRNPIGEYTMIGEIITILLTPKRGSRDFLRDYVDAELIGQSREKTCGSVYKGCPVSLFNLLRQYSKFSDEHDGNIEYQEDDEHEWDHHHGDLLLDKELVTDLPMHLENSL